MIDDLTIDSFYDQIAKVKENYRERAGQRECSHLIGQAIDESQHFMGEAGTGFGKSIALMVPAITKAVRAGKRIVISTGTIALQEQYCVAPSTRILTEDLRYVPAEDVRAGMQVVGFDEEANGHRRHFRTADVVSVKRFIRPCYRLVFDDGTTVVASSEHAWLCARGSGRPHWMTTERMLVPVGKKPGSRVVKFFDVWNCRDTSYEAGYLAAAFDGEGHLAQHRETKHFQGVTNALVFAQRANEMYAEVQRCLDKLGFRYRTGKRRQDTCREIRITPRKELVRFLGTVRPARLLPKYASEKLGSALAPETVRLITKEYLGEQEVIAISTSTRTFITEGLASHNCNLDLPLLQQALGGSGFTFALAKGRSNYVCRAKLVEAIANRNMTPIQQWAEKQRPGYDLGDYGSAPSFCTQRDWNEVAAEEECERRACQFYGDGAAGQTECFVFEAIRKRNEAQIIVTNHTMFLLDLWLGNGIGHPILGEYDVAIIDEAHELPEKAQQTWGSEFGPTTISRSIRLFEKMLTRAGVEGVFEDGYLMPYQMMEEEIFKPFQKHLKEATPLDRIKAATDESRKIAEEVANELKALHKKIKEAAANYGSMTPQYDATTTARERLSRLYSNLLRVYGENVGDDDETRWLSYLEPRWNAKREKYGVLHSRPITVAPLLKTLLFDQIPTVALMSATMRVNNSFSFMRRELGVPKDRCLTFVGESPFDYENNVTGYFPTHLPDQTDENYEEALASEIVKLIERGDGKALVLFTSNKLMDEIFARVSRRVKYPCMVQGSAPKTRLIEQFKDDVHSCLFATRSFFTGIDIPGEALSTVILTKAPFRVPSEPMFAARCDLIKREGGNDFVDYSMPLMILDVRQAFGRLIRTESDKGLFGMLDSRAMKKNYGANIRKSLPAIKRVTEI